MSIIDQLNRPGPSSLNRLPLTCLTAAVHGVGGLMNLAAATPGHIIVGLAALGLAGYWTMEIYNLLRTIDVTPVTHGREPSPDHSHASPPDREDSP